MASATMPSTRCVQGEGNRHQYADVLTNDVADLGVAMMLCQSRGMIGAESWVKDGSWATKGLYPLNASGVGRKAGVSGLGRIGFEVAKRLKDSTWTSPTATCPAKDYARGPDVHCRSDRTRPARGFPICHARRFCCHSPHRFEKRDRGARTGGDAHQHLARFQYR